MGEECEGSSTQNCTIDGYAGKKTCGTNCKFSACAPTQSCGDGIKNGPRPEEREMAEKGRRSLHASIAIAAGQAITHDMLVAKRPGLGIPLFLRDQVAGRTARRDIEADEWITWDMV